MGFHPVDVVLHGAGMLGWKRLRGCFLRSRLFAQLPHSDQKGRHRWMTPFSLSGYIQRDHGGNGSGETKLTTQLPIGGQLSAILRTVFAPFSQLLFAEQL